MNLHRYSLTETISGKVVKKVLLTPEEKIILNYAYALNNTTLKYIKTGN